MSTKTATKNIAVDAAKQIEDAVNVSKETIEATVKASADAVGKSCEKAFAMTKENMDAALKAGSNAFKGYEDVVAFNKDNIEAIIKSANIMAKGFQDLSKSFFSLTQTMVEESVVTGKSVLSAKSLKEAAELQQAAATANFNKIVSETERFSKLSMGLAEEAIQPVSARANEAFSLVFKAAA